jgi:hypothetical protein
VVWRFPAAWPTGYGCRIKDEIPNTVAAQTSQAIDDDAGISSSTGDHELREWADRLGCTPDELRAAVRKVEQADRWQHRRSSR